mgnify:CR=1 FL=1
MKNSDSKQKHQMTRKSNEGKTKKMAKGGPTSESMREYGRNMARARNQG